MYNNLNKCFLCKIDNEAHNKYFLTLFNVNKQLLLPFKKFDYEKLSFEEKNFSKPFNLALESCFLSGIYWTLSSLIILNPTKSLPEIIEYDDLLAIFNAVTACSQSPREGAIGFAPFYKDFYYSPTILHTLHAFQIFLLLSKYIKDVTQWVLNNSFAVINFLKMQIMPNGGVRRAFYPISEGFLGDIRDIASLFGVIYIIEKLTGIDYSYEFSNFIDKIITQILKCKNDDGGYALREGGSSHIGACFCVAAIGKMPIFKDFINSNLVDDSIYTWLISRQTSVGGLSGHGAKPPDVCYSYWFLATLSLLDMDIGKEPQFDIPLLVQYIQSCANDKGGFCKQSNERGEIQCFSIVFGSDNTPDPYHTFASLSSLLLLGMGLDSLCPQHKLITIDPLTAVVAQ